LGSMVSGTRETLCTGSAQKSATFGSITNASISRRKPRPCTVTRSRSTLAVREHRWAGVVSGTLI
jgi:hypothetical protein